jgi:hypothetical protein
MTYGAQWEALRGALRSGGAPPATLHDGRAATALALEAEALLLETREGAPA